MEENLQTFICECLGIPECICKIYDETEKNFRSDEYYNLDESLVKEIVRNTVDRKDFRAGHFLLLDLYDRIIEHYIDAYCDYPLDRDLFSYDLDGAYSELRFNGNKVTSAQELDKAIEEWILEIQSK